MSQEHWDTIYETKEETNLGWFQKELQPDVDMITDLKIPKTGKLVIAGSGTSKLVDKLVELGYENIVLTDISEVALEKVQERIKGKNRIHFVVDDLGQPTELQKLKHVDLWYDRAALHFLNDPDQINRYSLLLEKIQPLRIFLAQFSTDGATKCSGLPIRQYDERRLREVVPSDYELVHSKDVIYVNPSGGKRPYIYALFTKKLQ